MNRRDALKTIAATPLLCAPLAAGSKPMFGEPIPEPCREIIYTCTIERHGNLCAELCGAHDGNGIIDSVMCDSIHGDSGAHIGWKVTATVRRIVPFKAGKFVTDSGGHEVYVPGHRRVNVLEEMRKHGGEDVRSEIVGG